MDKRKCKISKVLTLVGVLCICIATIIAGNNIYKDYKAKILSKGALEAIEKEISVEAYKSKGEGRMSFIEVDGKRYIGVLKIPKLSISLPIQSEWSDELLNASPCRYEGSSYEDSMVLMGHNYKSHFGPIGRLDFGDEVIFIDVDGVEYTYSVIKKETLNKSQVEEMISGDWDLTLFTCDYSRVNRTTIRFKRI